MVTLFALDLAGDAVPAIRNIDMKNEYIIIGAIGKKDGYQSDIEIDM